MPSPSKTRAIAYALAAVLLASVTWVDLLTGYELGLFVLYFVPVGIASWYGSRRAGLAFAVAAAAGWYASDLLGHHPYSNQLLIYWETFMRFVAFAITALALSRIRSEMRRQEDLLRVVSHDLRTPLAALEGQASILRRKAGSDEWVAARADAILRASQRMDAMIQDLVDGARHQAGQLRLELRAFELGPYLADFLRRMEGTLDVERVDLAVAATSPLRVRADPDRLERILVNLLSNALKYSPPEGRVRVDALDRGAWLVLSVADEGPGIAPEDLPFLFERYYRGRAAGGLEGLGVGLHSARMLVEAHGGRIRVENVPGAGARFVVELPAPPEKPAGGKDSRAKGAA
jgi:signal transduction histidine kinase